MEKLDSALCQWTVLYIYYFNFLIFMHSTNQITIQQSLNLIFKVTQTTQKTPPPPHTHTHTSDSIFGGGQVPTMIYHGKTLRTPVSFCI